MAVQINFFSLLKLELNQSQVEYEVEKKTKIKDIIARLDQQFAGEFSRRLLEENKNKIKMGTIVLLNGHNIIHLAGLETEVEDGDKIAIFPPAAGG